MGCSLYCCFRNLAPKVIAIIALVTNIIAFAFLIWAIIDLHWLRKGRQALFIITFVLFILILILLIIVLILLGLIRNNVYAYGQIGKILCLIIIVLCILAFIFLLIFEILEIIDYADVEDIAPGRNIPAHDWAAAILPGILGLIALVIIALCANALYTIFTFNIFTSIFHYENNTPVIVNSITQMNPQNEVIITGNNAGVIPPVVVNKPV